MKHLTATLILLACFAPPVLAGAPIDETLPVAANSAIEIVLFKGTLRIRSWEQNAVRINGELGEVTADYSFSQIGTTLTFSENIPDAFWQRSCAFASPCNDNERDGGALLEILVPRQATLRVNGMHIDVDIAALDGNILVQLGQGNILAEELSGLITLETGVGNIQSTALRGKATLQTTAGTIEDEGSSGEHMSYRTLDGGIQVTSSAARISAETNSGAIALNLGVANEIDASSVNSGITASFTPDHDAIVELTTTNGNVDLTLPATLSTQMEFTSTKSGEFKHPFAVRSVRTADKIDGAQERFTLGAGEAIVRVSTVTGAVTVALSERRI